MTDLRCLGCCVLMLVSSLGYAQSFDNTWLDISTHSGEGRRSLDVDGTSIKTSVAVRQHYRFTAAYAVQRSADSLHFGDRTQRARSAQLYTGFGLQQPISQSLQLRCSLEYFRARIGHTPRRLVYEGPVVRLGLRGTIRRNAEWTLELNHVSAEIDKQLGYRFDLQYRFGRQFAVGLDHERVFDTRATGFFVRLYLSPGRT